MIENKGLEVIKVVGIGQGGVNSINRMIEDGIKGVEFIAMNTDAQSLMISDADVKLDIGRSLTKGLGTGGDPEIGRQATEEHVDEIKEILDGANMVFITTGEGGGTGTGGAPVVARVAKEIGALTVGVVTRPFEFEGRRKKEIANNGIEQLIPDADTTIVIPNERLLEIDDGISLMDAFKKADEILTAGIQGVTEILINPGLLQIDFSDVETVFKNAGTALMGIGSAKGDGRTVAAVEEAINSNLLEQPIDGAKGAIINFQAGPDLSLNEFHDAALLIKNKLHPEAHYKYGVAFDESLADEVRATVFAAGFERTVEYNDPEPDNEGVFEPTPISTHDEKFENNIKKDESLLSEENKIGETTEIKSENLFEKKENNESSEFDDFLK